jgi:mRNA-degrading endonuclease RelE of RelBE toxin-antitoxin system
MMMNYDQTPEFKKDWKRLIKKYGTLDEDLETFEKVTGIQPVGEGRHSTVLQRKGNCEIVKARLFCKALRGASLRVIYAYHGETQTIRYIELYFKGDKANEDALRIRAYLKGF